MDFNIEKVIYEIELRRTCLSNIDNLTQFIEKIEEKKLKDNLNILKFYYIKAIEQELKSNLDGSIEYINKSLDISNKINNNLWEGKCYCKLACIYLNKGEYKISRRYFIKGAKLLEKEDKKELTLAYIQRLIVLRWKQCHKQNLKKYIEKIRFLMKFCNDKECGYYYLSIGTTLAYFLQDEIKAMKYFIKGMRIGEKYDILEITGLVLYYFASIYLECMHNPNEAIRSLEELVYSSKYDNLNKELKCSSIVALIESYLEMDKLHQAYYCIEAIDQYIKNIDNELDESTNIMLIYLKSKCFCKSNKNLNKGISLALEALEKYETFKYSFKYTHFDCNINILIGDFYFKLGVYDNSIKYYKRSLDHSSKWGKFYEKKAYSCLGKVYEIKEDYKNSLKCYRICESIFDYIQKKQSFIKYEKMQKEFEKIYNEEKIKNLNIYNKSIKEESYKDPLTKVFNRTYLDEYISEICNTESMFAIMIDIDYFKTYNDNYGHLKGDEVLINVAQIIKSSCNELTDIVIRYGGEEFLVLSCNEEKDYFENLPLKIKNNINSLNILHEYSLISDIITASIGVANINLYNSCDCINLIKKADKALYIAKEQGRNRIIQYDNKKTLNI
ncbi:GGDEF domain-containing protein [Romboutsia lituseburensis]|uniref:tetratricopeptide repeat-containing diguanylate cyclase n=1 Tax=Romboutsia lituseburensis TaxID=1537 RepID=UPI00215AB465|nr:GGDEF domain-containing protein [Romboutsia lituseburensis]MCR8744896.1 GGDEF domain-containing protein [Romboutsia lituseburensis]